MQRMSDDVPAIEDDDLPPDPGDAAPAPRRAREPVDLLVRIKTEGMRLDHYLALNFQDFSRSELQKAIEAGTTTVNGRASKASYKVRNNDALHVELPEPTHDRPVPEDIPLDVLYQDDFLALVNKPADMVVHPAKGNWSGHARQRPGVPLPRASEHGQRRLPRRASSTGSTRTRAASSWSPRTTGDAPRADACSSRRGRCSRSTWRWWPGSWTATRTTSRPR